MGFFFCRLAVYADCSLGEHPAAFAVGLYQARYRQQSGQVYRVVLRQDVAGGVFGGLVGAELAVEGLLGLLPRSRAVVKVGYGAGQRPLRLPRMGRPRRQSGGQIFGPFPVQAGGQAQPLRHGLVGDAHRLPEHFLRRLVDPDVVTQRLRHFHPPVGAHQQRHRQNHLRALAEPLLHLAAHNQVEQLVGSPQLHVRLDRYRIVGLQQRIHELHHGNGTFGREPLGEIVPLQHLRQSGHRRQAQHVGHVQTGQPLRIAANLQVVLRQNFAEPAQHRLRVLRHLLGGEPFAGFRTAARIPHLGGEIPHYQHRGVPQILELAEFAQNHRPPQSHRRGGRVQTQFHTQRAPLPQPRLQLVLREERFGAAQQPLRLMLGFHDRQE